jgi:Mrp family chromosome partitioning ATPase
VVSGKGGVGKSLVTSLLAKETQQRGYDIAILDADITGPSIPKSFGVTDRILGNEYGMFPAKTANGIKMMSLNLMLEDEATPAVWRGPIIAGTVKQFWTDTNWGNVDYMFVDMPPGTGDVPLTVFQSLPIDGVVIVTSPQDLVSMIVAKAVNMAGLMNVPVLGLVENMAYFKCPECGKEHAVFGESHAEETARSFGIAHTARLPIDPAIAAMVAAGEIESVDGAHIAPLADVMEGLLK